MRFRFLASAAAFAFLTACGGEAQEARPLADPPSPEVRTAEVERASEDGRLISFLDSLWEERLALSPEYQTRLGRKTAYDQWNDRSEAADDRYAALLREQLGELRSSFDREALSREGQLNYDLFVANTENTLALDGFRLKRYPSSQFRGFHSSVPVFLRNYHRIDSLADAEAYLTRVETIGRPLGQAAAQLEARVEAGYTLPAFSYPLMAEAARNIEAGESVAEDFEAKLASLDIAEEEKERLRERLTAAIEGPFREAYRDYAERISVLAEETADEGNLGVARFDEDGSYYAALLRNYTATDLTADEVHEIGLEEVARIQDEMRAIMEEVGFEGGLQEFFAFMREDEQFYLPNTDEGREEYLTLARSYIAGIEPKLDELFGIRPEASVEVRRVEPFRERAAGKAFYSQPDEEGTRPGYFYANLADMGDMPVYQLEALVYHEAVPGHHMQRALQLEQEELPKFRRFGSATAYTEGWGLYSELVPKEIGFYEDPYSDFGRLAMELWRAARLVVDTGLHAKGWEMQEAIAYLQENTPNPKGDTVKAIERYIVYPGQATAYKIGMLRILELREKAREALGDRFDIRGFHDTILKSGPLPLNVLEQQIDLWIEEQKNLG
jgi:uncharacterized protein (DUF885 family)